MSYVRVESSVRTNRKFLRAGPAASWLWLCGLAYCQDTLTDGFIPGEALPYLGVERPQRLVAHLVDARLWDEEVGGWRIHDYLKHNKPAEEIDRIKRERVNGGHLGGRPPKENLEGKPSAEAEVNHAGNPSTSTSTAVPTATSSETYGARAHTAPLHSTHHRKHAHCGRVCLPASLFDEFVRRRNHADADMEIRDWALTVEREWGTESRHAGDEPGDPFEFWKARYADHWPTATHAQASKWEANLPPWARKVRAAKAAQP